MRATSRLLATVKSASKYLEPNTPTGLTGLTTHPSPRPALVWTYRQTLKKLEQIPRNSVYRQSVEALTKHRLEIVESTKPEGYEQWLERVKKQIEASPKAYSQLLNEEGSLASEKPHVEHIDNWDGQITRADAHPEGTNDMAQAERKTRAVEAEVRAKNVEEKEGIQPTVEDLEVEPPLTREQISALETNIGAGLIEEVIAVAEGELLLVDEMLRHQVWDELEEQSPPGQWKYFERGERV
ncbi:NADH-ubiquinone oxidoreductase [Cladophialophora carrionii]|uniref:NADH-ubiquinone oxidoreductase n=1 Tax=Cladophialophora carrionii TaxID=86049 RepID=A0A1C1CS86_9EURO|nr:NADH-ubiquinone oxidoreductase [Cladophialophora carrionii]